MERDRVDARKSKVQVRVDADRELLGIELIARPAGGPPLVVAHHAAEGRGHDGAAARAHDGVLGAAELGREAAEAPFGAADIQGARRRLDIVRPVATRVAVGLAVAVGHAGARLAVWGEAVSRYLTWSEGCVRVEKEKNSQSGPSPQKPNLLQQPVSHGLEALQSWACTTTTPRPATKARRPRNRPRPSRNNIGGQRGSEVRDPTLKRGSRGALAVRSRSRQLAMMSLEKRERHVMLPTGPTLEMYYYGTCTSRVVTLRQRNMIPAWLQNLQN